MANVKMCTDQFQQDKRQSGRSSGGPSAGGQSLDGPSATGQSLGGLSATGQSLGGPSAAGQSLDGRLQGGQSNRSDYPHHSQDGAFERFLSSAIVAILTILFSWRMLMLTSTDDASSGQSNDQCTGQRGGRDEATTPETGKPHTPGIPLGSGNDSSTANEKRNMEPNSSVSGLTADRCPIGSVMTMAGQSSVGDGCLISNSSCSSFHRSSAPADSSPEADIGDATDDVKWAERSVTPHCDSGKLSGAANRYAGNTISGRPQIFKAETAAEYDSNHISVKNGDYLERNGDRHAENVPESKDEGQQSVISHSPLGDWDQPHRLKDTTETELQGNHYA